MTKPTMPRHGPFLNNAVTMTELVAKHGALEVAQALADVARTEYGPAYETLADGIEEAIDRAEMDGLTFGES